MTTIEMALAHHEMHIHDLETVIGRQWGEIDRLKRMIEKLQGRLDAMETAGGGNAEPSSVTDMAAANKPPHY